MASTEIRRGDVWWVTLDPTIGSELQKRRPCLVVQRDAANANSPTTIICPLTSARNRVADIIKVSVTSSGAGLPTQSLVVCNQLRTVDRRRFGERIGSVSADEMSAVDRGLRAILDL